MVKADFPKVPVEDHVCVGKASVKQNRIPVGTGFVCRACGTIWVVVEQDVSGLDRKPRYPFEWARA